MPRVPTSVLLVCGAAGPIVFVGGFLAVGATRPDYDPMRHFVSLLSLTSAGWSMALIFVISGILVLSAALGLRRVLRSGPGRGWVPLGVGLAGAGLVLAGLFPTDAIQGYPPGAPTVMPSSASATAAVHLTAALLIFLFLPVAAIVAGRRLRAEGRSHAAVGSVVCAVVMVCANAVTSAAPGSAGLVPDVAGLLQRVSLTAGFAWLAWFSIDRRRNALTVGDQGT